MRYEKPTLVTMTLAELANTQMTAKLQEQLDDVIIIIKPAPCRAAPGLETC